MKASIPADAGNFAIDPSGSGEYWAGVAVYERGSSGLLSAARIYDDVEPPAVPDTPAS